MGVCVVAQSSRGKVGTLWKAACAFRVMCVCRTRLHRFVTPVLGFVWGNGALLHRGLAAAGVLLLVRRGVGVGEGVRLNVCLVRGRVGGGRWARVQAQGVARDGAELRWIQAKADGCGTGAGLRGLRLGRQHVRLRLWVSRETRELSSDGSMCMWLWLHWSVHARALERRRRVRSRSRRTNVGETSDELEGW